MFSDYNLRYNFFFSGRKVRIWRSDSVAIFRSAKTIILQGSDVIRRAKDTSFMAERKKDVLEKRTVPLATRCYKLLARRE